MGDTRITQGGVEVLAGYTSTIRTTRAGVEVLASYPTAQTRMTRVGIEVLADAYPCLTHMAQCWKITRTDGQVFAYTSADFVVAYGGVDHQPCDSLAAAANQLGAELGSVGDTELMGIISDDGITEADLANGLFEDADVEIWMVPWADDGTTAWRLSKGIITSVEHGRVSYQAEVLTPGARLQQKPLLEFVTPGCRYELGDDRCQFDIYSATVAGDVTAVATADASSSASFRVFYDTARTEESDYFEGGIVEWQTGANAGAQSEVKEYDLSTGRIILWDPLAEAIEVGDVYTIRPGCGKDPDTCKNRFNNYVNYGGFPDLPGEDEVRQTPPAKG